jgi:hypothetical protein
MAVRTVRSKPLGLFPDRSAPRLYNRIGEVLHVKHDSRRTEEAYVTWIGRSIEFHRQRYPHDSGTARSLGCESHNDRHPSVNSERQRSPQSGRPALTQAGARKDIRHAAAGYPSAGNSHDSPQYSVDQYVALFPPGSSRNNIPHDSANYHAGRENPRAG